jgi:hypothetical protein
MSEKLVHFLSTTRELCIGLVNKKRVSAVGKIVSLCTIAIRDLAPRELYRDSNLTLLLSPQESDRACPPKSKPDSKNLIMDKKYLKLTTNSVTGELKLNISPCLIKTPLYFTNHNSVALQSCRQLLAGMIIRQLRLSWVRVLEWKLQK